MKGRSENGTSFWKGGRIRGKMRASWGTGAVGEGEAEFAVGGDPEVDAACAVSDWMNVVAIEKCSKVRRSTGVVAKMRGWRTMDLRGGRADVGQTFEQFEA